MEPKGVVVSLLLDETIRGMVPRLYAWKSAKWIKAVELAAADRPGFWEEPGYHLRGDPRREERYREA